MARPGIEPRTPDLRVRCPTDCALRPGLIDDRFCLCCSTFKYDEAWNSFEKVRFFQAGNLFYLLYGERVRVQGKYFCHFHVPFLLNRGHIPTERFQWLA